MNIFVILCYVSLELQTKDHQRLLEITFYILYLCCIREDLLYKNDSENQSILTTDVSNV